MCYFGGSGLTLIAMAYITSAITAVIPTSQGVLGYNYNYLGGTGVFDYDFINAWLFGVALGE